MTVLPHYSNSVTKHTYIVGIVPLTEREDCFNLLWDCYRALQKGKEGLKNRKIGR